MKITLEPPYSEDWKYGYLLTNKENRKTIILYNSDNNRSSTQYARYVLAVSLGRYLTPDEEADHIDGDKTNDNFNNLQVLSKQEHLIKTKSETYLNSRVTLICPRCNSSFTRTRAYVKSHSGSKLHCSRPCASKDAIKNLKQGKIPQHMIDLILHYAATGLSSYKIHDILQDVSRATISRYIKLSAQTQT